MISPAAVVATIALAGHPFAAVPDAGGATVYVSTSALDDPSARTGIAVLSRTTSGLQVRSFVPLSGKSALGLALTPDGSTLLVASGDGVLLLDVASLGTSPAAPLAVDDATGAGTIKVAVTPDGRYAFASDERLAQISVIALERRSDGRLGGRRIGAVPVDRAPVGLTLSRDGATLYVPSEVVRPPAADLVPGNQDPQLGRRDCPPRGANYGTISAIDVKTAIADPAHADVARTAAGCAPVRAVLSDDGATLWVSSRGDDAVRSFDTAAIRNDPAHAFRTNVAVGPAPTGLALAASGTLLAVANSDRFGGGAPSTLTIVQLPASGGPSVTGTVAAGVFPRELSLSPDGKTLYLTNFNSRTLELFDVAALHGT